MNVINFAECKYKILRSSSWTKPVKVISDETRSGASKRRIGITSTPKTYSVTMSFSVEDYAKFIDWFENDDLNGYYSFWMKKIDAVDGEFYEYRFSSGTQLSISNTAGHIIEVSFDIEEIKAYR